MNKLLKLVKSAKTAVDIYNAIIEEAALATNTEPGLTGKEDSTTTSGSENSVKNVKVTAGPDAEVFNVEDYEAVVNKETN